MVGAALVFGVIAIVLGIALTLGLLLFVIGLVPFFVGALVVVVCIGLGLLLSVLALIRRRDSRSSAVLISAFAVNILALSGVIAVALIVRGLDEPTLDEAMSDLARELGVESYRIGLERPALLVLPSGYSQDQLERRAPLPLILSLHGYTSHYMSQDSYFGMSALVNSYNFALILPNGTRDAKGNRFWNATEFCCGIADSKPDDAEYLMGLVEEAAEEVNVDRVFVTGMSNGAFMSYRLACESMPGLVGIVAVAGSSYSDEIRCDSARPVSVLHIHGNGDETVRFEGGSNPDIGEGSHPAAGDVIQRWARRAGCDLSASETLSNLDIDAAVSGKETAVTRYRSGCRDDLVVEFWEMESSSHIPKLSEDFGELILDWLFRGPDQG